MIELDQIRGVFPDWPSELDTAKQSSNWVMMAQKFYCAAIVLNEEKIRAHRRMHTEIGKQVSIDLLKRDQVGVPAIFCLAFSLELAIKAALIHQGAIADLESGKPLPISSHSLDNLAKRVKGLNLTPNEEQWLVRAASVIANGKYPAGLKPSEVKDGVPLYPHFEDFLLTAEPLYGRLIKLAAI